MLWSGVIELGLGSIPAHTSTLLHPSFHVAFQEQAKEQHVPITVFPHPAAAEPLALQTEKESTRVMRSLFSFSDPSISHPGIASIFFFPIACDLICGKAFLSLPLVCCFQVCIEDSQCCTLLSLPCCCCVGLQSPHGFTKCWRFYTAPYWKLVLKGKWVYAPLQRASEDQKNHFS